MIQSIISAVTGEKSDPSDLQLANYKKSNNPKVINMSNGCPIYDKRNSLTVGPRGPQLMEDIVYLDEITHFDRERIPERVVHAKGAESMLKSREIVGGICKRQLSKQRRIAKTSIMTNVIFTSFAHYSVPLTD
ncbi:unnamed protein product [Cylicostephanus goldi]|uniref:Catalase core domain-containing protein n=1 Tax=Cylicostephanus goldi TaxID=71465 RepID=A0A3P6R0Z7_CYLGO|nr:unnamed protein product [Cylicostephanus goldi]